MLCVFSAGIALVSAARATACREDVVAVDPGEPFGQLGHVAVAELRGRPLACCLTSEVPVRRFVRVAWRVAVTAGGHRDTVGSCPREIGGGGGGRGVQYGLAAGCGPGWAG